jgi:ATP-dependent RNA helicase DeaD
MTNVPVTGDAVVSRGQNQLHIIPEDWNAAGDILLPLIDRLDPAKATAQLLVITGDAESAAALSGRIVRAADERSLRTLAATDARRAARVLKALPTHVVVTHPSVLIELTKSAAVKLESLSVVALAWVDTLSGSAAQALESLMAEVPKDAARVVIAAHATPEVEQLVERYARRARRVLATGAQPLPPVSLSYVTTSESGKLDALRRVLDALDPESAVVVARTSTSRDVVRSLLRAMGYRDEDPVRVVDVASSASVVIFFDFPTDENDARRPGNRSRIVALVTARQLASLRRLAGGSVTPFALPEAAARARSREDALRDEIRAVLETGQYGRELLALDALLADYDGSEIAAAAVRLLEAERARAAAPAPAAATPAMTKLFVNVGEMDQVRPGDLVGAITNEGGIARGEIGRVEVREKHSTVEVATHVANAVVEKMTGVAIRGRRALVKIDEERQRPPRSGGRSDGPRRDRGDRPQRSSRPQRPRPTR